MHWTGCHGGGDNPAARGWLVGATEPTDAFPLGPCATQPGATPCYMQAPRNLTPDDATGIGRYSERQIFNALRFGLRPGATPDVEITSSTPGQGNFPEHPDYLGPGMPWPAWRFMADNDSPADRWSSEFTIEKIGVWPAPPFPTANEVRR